MTDYLVSCDPFECATQKETQEALKILKGCERVIVTTNRFGFANSENARIIEEAERLGLPVEYM